jgi:uncharacterized glyoxalase superfamily protein PhnB
LAKLSRIAPELPVSNMETSIGYYQHKLGFELTLRMPSQDYAIVERDEVAIHLFKDDVRHHSPVGLHIFTPDLEALHKELMQRGAHLSQPIVRKPWGNRDFRVRDDFGNELKFTEPLSGEE